MDFFVLNCNFCSQTSAKDVCMDISYTDLRCKDVVNVVNGSKMGKIVDLIVDSNGKCVLGLVVPGIRKIFKSNEDIFIPWESIVKIGNDTILINLDLSAVTNVVHKAKGAQEPGGEDYL